MRGLTNNRAAAHTPTAIASPNCQNQTEANLSGKGRGSLPLILKQAVGALD
jgi:hypothetical protein